MSEEKTKLFIQEHLSDDVKRLALTKPGAGIDLRFALQQIDGRQRAKSKLPLLSANPDIVFPVHLSVEQCSSEATARYKADLLKDYLSRQKNEEYSSVNVLTDLTGGFGIDFMALAAHFAKAVYVERNEELCEIARQNFRTLSIRNAEVINSEAEELLNRLHDEEKTLFFIDPARRSESGSRTFAISDCTPDVISLMPQLKKLGSLLFLKLSPMLDWHKAVEDIENCGANVAEVHIVSVKNECKELLLLVELQSDSQQKQADCSVPRTPETQETRLFCKNDDSVIEIIPNGSPSGNTATVSPATDNTAIVSAATDNTAFLLLPNASVMKAGCWDFIIRRYGVTPADRNSHLFFSDRKVPDFPGKQYAVQAICSMNKKELKTALSGISKANISVRNFPLSAEALRKRLKLKDGGSTYIFGTTIRGEHKLIIAQP